MTKPGLSSPGRPKVRVQRTTREIPVRRGLERGERSLRVDLTASTNRQLGFERQAWLGADQSFAIQRFDAETGEIHNSVGRLLLNVSDHSTVRHRISHCRLAEAGWPRSPPQPGADFPEAVCHACAAPPLLFGLDGLSPWRVRHRIRYPPEGALALIASPVAIVLRCRQSVFRPKRCPAAHVGTPCD